MSGCKITEFNYLIYKLEGEEELLSLKGEGGFIWTFGLQTFDWKRFKFKKLEVEEKKCLP